MNEQTPEPKKDSDSVVPEQPVTDVPATPEPVTPAVPTESQAAPVAEAQNSLMKDLAIPISIVIAGMFIGAGLYFGGAPGTGSNVVANDGQPQAAAQQQTGDLDAVAEVTSEDWIKGSPDAPIKIVEYSDYDCPFCSRFHTTMDEIVAENDDVAWVFRHFPLEQLHPNAVAVAVAAECVGSLGGENAFWQFTDEYFEVRGGGDRSAHATLIPQLVTNTGVDADAFQTCFENGEFVDEVQADLDNAVETGGRGTPWSVLIGPDGTTYPINGAVPKQTVQQVIDAARAEG